MIVFSVPFRHKTVKINSREEQVLELVEGFWDAEMDGEAAWGPDGTTIHLASLTRDLRDVITGYFSALTSNEPLLIKLVNAQQYNPGVDNEQASLHNDLIFPQS